MRRSVPYSSRRQANACRLYLWRYRRHASACHLLRAGVDINTIRAWLGHVSLSTTNVYAEVDLEMKAKALARADLGNVGTMAKRWRKEPSLIGFLKGI